MAWTLVNSGSAGFSDGNAGHTFSFGSAPSVGDLDILCLDSDTTISTPSGFTLPTNGSHVANAGAYFFFRFATGGESDNVVVTTAGNHPTALGWVRFSGGDSLDGGAKAAASTSGTTTPSVTTSTLAQAGELAVAFAGLHNFSTAPASPSWSAGYTGVINVAQGTGSTAPAVLIAYKDNAGTASESPSVSWTNACIDRYIFVFAFKPAASTPNVSDSALLSDTSSLAASTSVTDSGTLTDTSAVELPVTDSASFSDVSSLTAQVDVADTATVTDTASLTADIPASDTAAFTDSAQLDYTAVPSETGTLTDTASIAATLTATDSAAFTDAAVVELLLSDSATFTDSITSLTAAISPTDTATLTETASVTVQVSASDSFTFTDNGFAAEPGIDIRVRAGNPARNWSAGTPWI